MSFLDAMAAIELYGDNMGALTIAHVTGASVGVPADELGGVLLVPAVAVCRGTGDELEVLHLCASETEARALRFLLEHPKLLKTALESAHAECWESP